MEKLVIDRQVHPLKIILETRLSKPAVTIGCAEIDFISPQTHLQFHEKWLWLILVRLSYRDPKLTCTVAYEEVSKHAGMEADTARRVMTRLNTMGYLKTLEHHPGGQVYKIDYPLEGLLALKSSPKVPYDNEKSKINIYDLRTSPRPLSINLLNGYPVNRMHRDQLPDQNSAHKNDLEGVKEAMGGELLMLADIGETFVEDPSMQLDEPKYRQPLFICKSRSKKIRTKWARMLIKLCFRFL